MNVEREIAGITLPFTIGAIITVCTVKSFCTGGLVIHELAFAACLMCLCGLLLRKKLCLGDGVVRGLIILSTCSCGALSGAVSTYHIPFADCSSFEEYAVGFGLRMQNAIDSIPFSSAQTNALLKALLTGERGNLSPELTEAFRDSGASHILALSGLHLGIIYGIFSKVFFFLGGSMAGRRIRSAVIVILCGFYTLATGAGPSIVRAFIFILLGETARMTGRLHSLRQVLMASLLIQVALDPVSLRSVSFQLSYAAMAGIAFLYPWIRDFWPSGRAGDDSRGDSRSGGFGVDDSADSSDDSSGYGATTLGGKALVKAMRWVWNSAALSISCQLTTGPLAYMYFGTFPRHFLLTNLISLPLTGIIIPFALACLGLSGLGWCPAFMVSVTEWLVSLLTWSLEVIASM